MTSMVWCYVQTLLTRFNKICHPSQRPRWQVDKEAIGLSRVQQCSFLVKHKLLNSSQHGFLKARSCLTNMLCFLEEITKWIDVGSPVDIIYLDFQKAFDKVPHQRLLLKLKAHGIGDSITDWIEQWLTLILILEVPHSKPISNLKLLHLLQLVVFCQSAIDKTISNTFSPLVGSSTC